MKQKKITRALCLVLVLSMLLGAVPAFAASSGTSGTISWSVDGGVLTIGGYGTMNDYSSGGAPWYSYRSMITSVVIEDRVTGIGEYAFYNLYNVNEVSIPGSVNYISRSAFRDCDALEFLYIPEGVEALSDYAFYDCDELKAVYVPTTVYSSYSYYPFTGCYNLGTIYGAEGTDAEWLAENIGANFIPAECSGVELSTGPDKTEYMLGEEFDPTGLSLLMAYNGGVFYAQVTSGFTCEGFDSNLTGQQVITVR